MSGLWLAKIIPFWLFTFIQLKWINTANLEDNNIQGIVIREEKNIHRALEAYSKELQDYNDGLERAFRIIVTIRWWERAFLLSLSLRFKPRSSYGDFITE